MQISIKQIIQSTITHLEDQLNAMHFSCSQETPLTLLNNTKAHNARSTHFTNSSLQAPITFF